MKIYDFYSLLNKWVFKRGIKGVFNSNETELNLTFNSYFASLVEVFRNDYKIYIQMVNKNVATARFGFLINP